MNNFLYSIQGNFKKHRLIITIFLFSLAAIQGTSFTLTNNYKEFATPDSGTHLGLASGKFNQSPYRKYRIIIPFMATAIDWAFGGIF
jgi:hypothetical protein